MLRRILFFSILGLCLAGATVQARDPKVEEMAYVREIAGFLNEDAVELQVTVNHALGGNIQFRSLVESLGKLRVQTQDFHDKVERNTRAPWRTSSAYRDLTAAFENAAQAFIDKQVYLADPRAFEEFAFLMGALLQFYQEPTYQIVVPGYGNSGGYPTYPRAYYPWIPSFYSFINIRFGNIRTYPWARGIVFR